MNWISPTGLRPCAAMPTHMPLIASSASGVSMTRSLPKRCCNPTVARNTPPLTPTSSPRTTTFGSSSMARASARLMASTKVSSGIRRSLHLFTLAGICLRKLGIEMVEHRLGRPRSDREIAFDCSLDALLTFGGKLLLLRLAPGVPAHEERPQAGDGLLLPARLHLLGRPVARSVIRGGVVAQAIGHGFDQTRTFACPRTLDRLDRRGAHRDHVIAVDLLAIETCGDGLLRQRLRRGLQLERHRYRPLIVVGHEHDRKLPDPGKIHRLPHVAFGGGAVAEQADSNARLLSEFESIGDAGSVGRLRCDRNAIGKIVRRARAAAAALVAAPKQQDFLHLHAAPEERAIVSIGGKQDIFGTHGAGDADRHRLLAQRNSVGAEAAGALQRHGFEVE